MRRARSMPQNPFIIATKSPRALSAFRISPPARFFCSCLRFALATYFACLFSCPFQKVRFSFQNPRTARGHQYRRSREGKETLPFSEKVDARLYFPPRHHQVSVGLRLRRLEAPLCAGGLFELPTGARLRRRSTPASVLSFLRNTHKRVRGERVSSFCSPTPNRRVCQGDALSRAFERESSRALWLCLDETGRSREGGVRSVLEPVLCRRPTLLDFGSKLVFESVSSPTLSL